MAKGDIIDTGGKACFMDDTVEVYVNLANDFTQDVSATLVDPMKAVFLAVVGLWIVIQGLRLVMAFSSPSQIIKEFVFVCIAWILLTQQGPNLVNDIFNASLSVSGSGAAVVMDTATQERSGGSFEPSGLGGMADLVCYTEQAMTDVLGVAGTIFKQTTLTNPVLPPLYGLLLVIPYLLVVVVYFSQVVVSIFRVMFLATISPYLMMAFGFGFFREEAINGVRTLLSSFLVLWGATIAVAVLVYGVVNMEKEMLQEAINGPEGLSLLNEKYFVIVALGWLGSAFLTEATALANSITRSMLNNTGVGIISAGMMGSGMALAKAGAGAAMGPAGMALGQGAALGKAVAGAAGSKALSASPRAQRVAQIVSSGLEKYNNFVNPEKK